MRASLEGDESCELDPEQGVPRCHGGAVLPADRAGSPLLQEWSATRRGGAIDAALRQWAAGDEATGAAAHAAAGNLTLECTSKL